MSKPERQKTMMLWRPPTAAATREGRQGHEGTPHVTTGEAYEATVSAASVEPGEHSRERVRDDGGDPSSAGTLQVGELIGERYKVLALAGHGGFAAVYRAADIEIPNHEVCVKLLNARADQTVSHDVQLRELSLIASVSHPSVVQFKDYGWHDGRLFFAMPWYRGKTLSSAAPMERADARRVFERSAYGLQAMHDSGICHHDIKPDNIFLADIAGFEAGFPVLLDLGIAAKRGEKPTALTPEYCSPETASAMLNAGDVEVQVGPPADVFALALSLRNMLAPEEAPLIGEELVPFLHKRSIEPIGAPARKDLAFLKPYFERWLSLDPLERPTAAELAVELAVLTAPEERRAERKRLVLRALPFVAVLLLMVVGLAFALRTKTEELVQQKQQVEQTIVSTNKRFEQLKLESKNQLDEKLLLAGQLKTERDRFIAQRDEARTALAATASQLERTRSEVKARTRERDQARGEVEARTADVARLTGERDQALSELAKRTQAVDALQKQLAARDASLKAQEAKLAALEAELKAQKAALKAAQSDVAAKDKALEKMTVGRKKAEDALAASEKELAKVASARDKLERDLERRTKERDDARERIKELERELKRKDAQLEKLAAANAKAAATKRKTKDPAPEASAP